MKRKGWLRSLIPSVALFLVCAEGARAQEAPRENTEIISPAPLATACVGLLPSVSRNVLRFGIQVSRMGSLDPHFAAASQDRAFADMVFNGLLRYQPGNAHKIEPDLAVRISEFKMVGEKQVWTVHLRRGVRFHPGPETSAYELTADDVVFSLGKSADSAHCAYAGEYVGMTFEKVDRYTATIVLEKPLSHTLFLPKLTNYAGGFIISRTAVGAMGYERFVRHPIGTGPFRFERHQPGKVLVLAANMDYFHGRPLLDGVEIHFLPDTGAREKTPLSGRMDVITASGEKVWAERIERKKGIVGYSGVPNSGSGSIARGGIPGQRGAHPDSE